MKALPTPTRDGRGFFILVLGEGGVRAAVDFIEAVEGLLKSDPTLETQDVVEKAIFGCFLNKKNRSQIFEKKNIYGESLINPRSH
ncbi:MULTISPECIES: hypothetical protein [unclassified Pseudomonas]|uniref:hypothetical protein n=1 Tax=unclassified Pseudomonas TaxID=196821 RepID=UPI001CBF7A74|nr:MULTISPECIES: hypothetical protein [unclassified Pseudomonas]